MKKITVMLIIWSLLPLYINAQRQTEYNRKGDEAMKHLDYRDAKLWYEEGVSYCDQYSINQLTSIWMADETMHMSMRTVMTKCFNCLNELATAKDTAAMKKLIAYYTEGIGTTKNEDSANYWEKQLEQIRNYTSEFYPPKKAKNPMKFFIGYHSSLSVAPYGIQMGGIGETVGWYVRLRSNLSFAPFAVECNNGNSTPEGFFDGKIPAFDDKEGDEYKKYKFLPGKNKETAEWKTNTLMGSAGILIKTFPNTYASAGIGYINYEVLYKYGEIDSNTSALLPGTENWAKTVDASFQSVVVDVDITYILAKRFYGTAGVSALKFKYVYPTIGIGILF
jgi:hypothetical protein